MSANVTVGCEGGRRAGRLLLLSLLVLTPAAYGQQSLNFFKNYFVTGDYVAAGVGLHHTGVNGFATANILIDPAKIPADADIVAAYLYWQTISSSGAPAASVLQGAKFKGNDISGNAVLLSPGGTAPCWSSGGGTGASNGSKAAWSYRADVLRYFPRRRPSDPSQPVRVDVAGAHQVRLPDMGGSNQLPSTLGAGLIIVYRVSGYSPQAGFQQPRQPLRSVVIYDGGQVMDNSTRMFSLTAQGFYEASPTAPNVRMTHFVANGQPNKTERLQVRGTASTADNRLIATNPFVGNLGFDVATFENAALDEALKGAMKATVTVDPGTNGSFDCLNWVAVALSAEVQDRDQDGLLDVWESRAAWANKPAALAAAYTTWPLTDPAGNALPDLERMGASAEVQDLFVQIDYMRAGDHSHLPSRTALDGVATAFRNAAPRPALVARGLCSATATRGQCPINVHFDVGSNYQPATPPSAATCASATAWVPACAIVPPTLAKGGNPIDEVACQPGAGCAFPNFAGVVGWKSGFRAYRDGLVSRPGGVQEPRLSRTRKDMFHYALFAHALGVEASAGVPRRTSGIADSAGGDLMVTLGLWDNQTGSSFVQGATLMHELGHNLGLRHGGLMPNNTLEPNCKPNYQSVMNYLFQVRGLLTAQGVPTLDFSRQQLPALGEGALSESAGLGVPPAYMSRWFAPSASSYIDTALRTLPATRRCDGSRLGPSDIPHVRVDADPRRGTALDWNADGVIAGTADQDANFDGALRQSFAGANDYAAMDLRQVGARRSIGSASMSYDVIDPLTGVAPLPPLPAIGGGLSLDAGYGDLGYGDLGYGDLGYGDLGYGDLGYGDLGYGDLGYGDLGYGDLGIPAGGEVLGDGDLNLDTAGSLANAPSALTATVLSNKLGIQLTWLAPTLGTPLSYQLYRVTGPAVSPTNFAARVLVATIAGNTTSAIDNTKTLKPNVTYTYFVVATLPPPVGCVPTAGYDCIGNIQSGVSNFVTIVF